MVTLYSTDCPRCKVLAQKLTEKGVDFEICKDVDKMIRRDFTSAPMLEVDKNTMDFMEAINWLNGKD